MVNFNTYKLSGSSPVMTADNFNGFFNAVSQGISTLNGIITEWKGSNQNVSYSPQAATSGARCTEALWVGNIQNFSIILDGFVSSDDYWSDASSSIKEKVTAISNLKNKKATSTSPGNEISMSEWNTLVDNVSTVLSSAETVFGAKRDAAVEARNYWHFGDSMPIVLAASAS